MRMVTLSHGCSSRVKLKSRYNSVIMVKGKGLVQGIQVLNSWDTVLVEREHGVTTPEVTANICLIAPIVIFFLQIIDMIMYVVCCCFCRGYRTRDGYETHGESGRAKKKKKGKEYRPAQSVQPQSRSFVASGSYQSAVPVHSYGGTDNLYQNVTPPPAYQA